MREIINERKQIGLQALKRGIEIDFLILNFFMYLTSVSKLQNDSHAIQEQAELKIAREYWHNEQHKLNQQYRKYDNEHRTWLTEAFHDPDLLSIFHEITRYRIWLDENTIQFRKTTVLPIIQLKFVDLKIELNKTILFFSLGKNYNLMKSLRRIFPMLLMLYK